MGDSETDVQEWMSSFRMCPTLAMLDRIEEKTKLLDLGLRFQHVNRRNKQGQSPLHCVLRDRDDDHDEHDDFQAVKVTTWLIEQGALISMADVAGDTPLHVAVRADREDLVETLLKKGADRRCVNKKQQSVDDVAVEPWMKSLLQAPTDDATCPPDRAPLLRSPMSHVPNSCYLSIFLESIEMAGCSTIRDPFLRISVLNPHMHRTETVQDTPNALIQNKHHLWWGNTWYMQHSLEHLCPGSFIVIELIRHNFASDAPQVLCWSFVCFEGCTNPPANGRQTLEMYATPVNPSSCSALDRFPGDALLHIDLSLSR